MAFTLPARISSARGAKREQLALALRRACTRKRKVTCLYLYMYVCTHGMFVCIHACMQACVSACMPLVYLFMYPCLCKRRCMSVCLRVCVSVPLPTWTYPPANHVPTYPPAHPPPSSMGPGSSSAGAERRDAPEQLRVSRFSSSSSFECVLSSLKCLGQFEVSVQCSVFCVVRRRALVSRDVKGVQVQRVLIPYDILCLEARKEADDPCPETSKKQSDELKPDQNGSL